MLLRKRNHSFLEEERVDVVELKKKLFPNAHTSDYWLRKATDARQRLGKNFISVELVSRRKPNLSSLPDETIDWYEKVMFCNHDPEKFEMASQFCKEDYQMTGLLDKGRDFGGEADVLYVLFIDGEIVATLGCKFVNPPIMNVYEFIFKKLTHEVMRCSIHPDLLYRVERSNAEQGKEYKGRYYTLVNVRNEILRVMFAKFCENYSHYYSLAKVYNWEIDLPDLYLNTHPSLVFRFNQALGRAIFRKEPAKFIEANFDKQSRIALKKGFKLHQLKPAEILRGWYME